MRSIDTIVIGGGQAGLAMSRCLLERGIEHVVLERGRVPERWRSERWDSLRLLTPNWQSRLPGLHGSSLACASPGLEPDGFMRATDLVTLLEGYARSFAAPVECETTVLGVTRQDDAWLVRTDRGDLRSRNVVVATGDADVPRVPSCARALDRSIEGVVPTRYKRPADVPQGAVLIVGASATGVQLAEELALAGREVTLAVGKHTRLPRSHRGRDIMRWLDVMGVLDERAEDVLDLDASRRQPSMQLVGRHAPLLDLAVLQGMGVRLAGRLTAIDGARASFAPDLEATTRLADEKLDRLLARIDAFADRWGVGDRQDFAPRARVSASNAPCSLNLRAERFGAVLWATGFVRSYPWLHASVLDGRGEIMHRGGVTMAPGLYVLGLRFLRRRSSSFLDGVGKDAAELAEHIDRRRRGRAAA